MTADVAVAGGLGCAVGMMTIGIIRRDVYALGAALLLAIGAWEHHKATAVSVDVEGGGP